MAGVPGAMLAGGIAAALGQRILKIDGVPYPTMAVLMSGMSDWAASVAARGPRQGPACKRYRSMMGFGVCVCEMPKASHDT